MERASRFLFVITCAVAVLSVPASAEPSGTEMQLACSHVIAEPGYYTPKEVQTCQSWIRTVIEDAEKEDVEWTKKIVHDMQDQH